MSAAADRSAAVELPPAWARLERATKAAAVGVEAWRSRALRAEADVEQLRRALEEAIARMEPSPELPAQLRRLRAEHAALRSRMAQAQRRIEGLLAWADALEPES